VNSLPALVPQFVEDDPLLSSEIGRAADALARADDGIRDMARCLLIPSIVEMEAVPASTNQTWPVPRK
jgi:hypothetical protein